MDIDQLPETFSGQDLGNLSACPHQILSTKICQSTVIASVLILGIINVVVIAGNILVVVAVFVSPKLRTVTNFFIVSLAVADLLVGIVVLPYSITHEALDVWIFGELWCQVWLAVDVWMCTSSILNLCAISVDRYLAVTRPFKYRSIMSSRRAKLLIAAVWVLSFIICFPPLVGWNDKSTQIATFTSFGGNNRSTNHLQSYTSSITSHWTETSRGGGGGVSESSNAIKNSWDSTPISLNPDELYANFGNPSTNRVIRSHHPQQQRSSSFNVSDLYDNNAIVHSSSNTSTLCIVTKCALINNKGYVIYSALGSFYIPMFVMLFFYWRIYLVASGTTRALKRGYRTTKSQKRKSGTDNSGPLPEERLTLRIHRGYPVSDFSSSSGGGGALPSGGSGNSSHTTSPNSHHHQLRRATSQKVSRNPPLSPCHCSSRRGGSARSHESEHCFDKSASRSGSVNKKSSATSSSSQNTESSETPNTSSSCSRKGSSNGKKTGPLVTRLSKRTTKWQAKRFHAETKAAKTVGIIVGGFVCCWLPFFTVYLTRAFCDSCIPDLLFSIFFWLGYCNSAINPFIYALFSRDFRNAFRNIICRCKFREETGVSSLIRQIHLPTFFEEMPEDKGDSSQQDFN